MSHSDDLRSVMSPQELSLGDAEALLAGRPAYLAPSGYRGAAELLNRMMSAPTRAEADVSSPAFKGALDALRGEVPDGLPAQVRDIRSHRTSRMVRLAAAMSAGVTLLGGTAAAAATGNLPAPAQHVVASVLSDFGVSVPGHTKPGSSTASPSNAQTHLPTTPAAQANGASALPGLCRAFLSPGTDRRAARFAVLIQGHGGSSSSVTGFCQSLLSASASGTPIGQTGGSGTRPGQAQLGGGPGQNGAGTGQNSGNPTPGSRPDQPGSNGQHVGSTSGSGSAPSTVPSGSGAAQQHGRLGPSG